MATSQHPSLKLNSPAYVEPMFYKWPLQTGAVGATHDSGIEILDAIRWVCEDMPEMKAALEHIALNEVDTTCYDSMRNVCDTYNKAIDSIAGLEKGTSLTEQRLNKFATRELLRHIVQLVYNTAVEEPDKLNKYESFSPEVYGETSFELVSQMIDQITISPDDVFIDLGSGVGQVVLQMAGALQLKSCLGIERAEVPSQYAIEMDLTFRRWMRWFGKKWNDYELIKGDFLADEHREKINSATIVFVNNFAFGPNVDHQLKERFADLRDGAKIVSSKSFCPLNFRITERNLSDIGTIMHVKEMSSLRGSVSWTDKPVSYYLHIIDRTKLERYFQRLKKGDENGTIRSGRYTRNNKENNENTTDSDQEVLNGNINVNLNTNANGNGNGNGNGNRHRRTWTDVTNYKDKSSHSDDEENNNSRNRKQSAMKKRKKLVRKAAQTKQTSALSATQTNGVQKKRSSKANATGVTTISNKKGGRKRNFKIVGLDLLHSHTLSSTSSQVMGRRLPPAPGCVDQQLTSLTGNMTHEELEIPVAPGETPYALQILLDLFRNQFMQSLDQMRNPAYKDTVNKQISDEKERNKNLLNRVNQLEKQIKVLIDDSVALLKARMNELGIEMTSQNDLLAKAKEIVGRHKDLQVTAAKLQAQVGQLERDHNHLVMNQVQLLASKHPKSDQVELNSQTSQELVLKEIASTLSHRKKLKDKLTSLEQDMQTIENGAPNAPASNSYPTDDKRLTTITPVHLVPTLHPPAAYTSATISLAPPSKPAPTTTKSQRKSRESRARSQEWPDIPDVGKIEENNPEILAQKILETGRQIEAGRLLGNNGKHKESVDQRKHPQQLNADNSLMPAPTVVVKSSRGGVVPAAATGAIVVAQQLSVQPKHASSKIIQDAPKVVNFEDRLKSIITSALCQDQEQRKSQPKPSNAQPSPTQPSAPNMFAKSYPNSQVAAPTANHNAPTHNFNPNIISGTHHLNAATTISAVKPSITNNMPNKQSADNSYAMISNKYPGVGGSGKYGQHPNQVQHASHSMAHYQKNHHAESSITPRHSPHGPSPINNYAPPSPAQQSSQHSHHRDNVNIDLSHHSHANRDHIPHQNQYVPHIDVKNEFKTPEKMRYERISNHVSIDEHNMNRAFIAENMSVAYNTSSRPSSTSSCASSGHHSLGRQMIAATPPLQSPNNLPDYTQVSPAKMALRRHLSQEKISAQFGPGNGTMSSKTIGDLVNGEIERTLEISHQSIINAAVDMSSMGSSIPSAAIINDRVQRPERVNVRVLDELMPPQHQQFGGAPTFNQRNREITKSPVHLHGQSNLATLAHVAHNHKQMSQPPTFSAGHTKPLTIQTISPRSTGSAQYSPSSNHSFSSPSMRQNEQMHQAQPTKYMPLPRADIKMNWESYFNESKTMMHPNQHQKQIVHSKREASEESHRNNGGPPLEGLAASLQQRVIAQMKIKEERDVERQKRAEINPLHNGSVTITPTAHIKTEAPSGLKRTSPITQHHRPAKIRPHYGNHMNDSMLSPNENHRDLMSPEINSMRSGERAHIRPKIDDGLICIDDGDDESHWQDRVSSGFDRLVAFASIELTKSRRSIEDGAPSTSPDSGINQSSDGRTFLSSSSSSSQLDAPTNLLRTVVPIMKTSPAEVLESPPPPDMPRTPSPSSPPPIYSAQSPFDPYMLHNSDEKLNVSSQYAYHNDAPEPNLPKIPLKYQRQSKSVSYKKKFRTWEYDDGANAGENDSLDDYNDFNHLHKASKFRPKGKNWRSHENDNQA